MDHRRVDRAGADRVAPDVVPREFDRDRFGQPDDAVLGGDVADQAGVGDEPGGRGGDRHRAALAALDHVRGDLPRDQEGAEQVDFELVDEFAFGAVHQARVGDDPVVDRDGIDLAELGHRPVDDPIDVGGAAGVGGEGEATTAAALDQALRLLKVLGGPHRHRGAGDLRADVEGRDVRPSFGEHHAERPTHPSRRAAHEHDLAVHVSHRLPVLRFAVVSLRVAPARRPAGAGSSRPDSPEPRPAASWGRCR